MPFPCYAQLSSEMFEYIIDGGRGKKEIKKDNKNFEL